MRFEAILASFVSFLLLSIPPCAKGEGGAGAEETSKALRPFAPDDLFRLEDVAEMTLSPDGELLAFSRQRSKAAAWLYGRYFLLGKDLSDIWVSAKDKEPINLTHGDLDGSGYFSPLWSPDGSHLALLRIDVADEVQLYIWDKATRHLTHIGRFNVALDEQPTGHASRFKWLDNNRLVVSIQEEGVKYWASIVERQAGLAAMHEWPKAWSGQVSTTSVLESGVPLDLTRFPVQRVAIVDLQGEARIIEASPTVREIQIAPDGKHIAFLRQIGLRPLGKNGLMLHPMHDRYGSRAQYAVMMANIAGRVTALQSGETLQVLPNSLQWSPDGRELAFLGASAWEKPLQVFRAVLSSQVSMKIQPMLLPDGLDPQALLWADARHLLCAAQNKLRGKESPTPRLDWWELPESGPVRKLTTSLNSVPDSLFPSRDGRALIGVTDGELWRLDTPSGRWSNLTVQFEPKIKRIVWPAADTGSNSIALDKTLWFSAEASQIETDKRLDLFSMDTASHIITQRSSLSEPAKVMVYREADDSTIYLAKGAKGTALTWTQGKSSRLIVEINTFLRDIAEGARRKIEYTGLDGQTLTGWIVLPPDYQPGKHYPLVTSVYAGHVFSDTPPPGLPPLEYYNSQLFAARGYAVLMPSMPLPPTPDYKDIPPSDPYLELTKGVLPAVDRVIELGIADPKRLAVFGHSFGGFSTYGLVTQTQRFNVAIASAGMSDWISLHGTLDPRFRYQEETENQYGVPHTWAIVTETGQMATGNPPWRDLGRYIRNSPITYVDRVKTPLLIIQGDMDTIAMSQGEELFSALYRQGKRARFMRYWGEGHVLDSPANIRDFWMQAYAWLDEFCDISRDANGDLVFDGDRVKSRHGAPLQFTPETWQQLWSRQRKQ